MLCFQLNVFWHYVPWLDHSPNLLNNDSTGSMKMSDIFGGKCMSQQSKENASVLESTLYFVILGKVDSLDI